MPKVDSFFAFLFVVLFLYLFSFATVNLIFALTQPPSVCMDTYHAGLAVRPWFMTMAGIDTILLLFLCIINYNYYSGKISQDNFKIFFIGTIIFFSLKWLRWTIIEMVVFSTGISKYCNGGVHTYGLSLVLIHSSMLTIVLIIFLLVCCCN